MAPTTLFNISQIDLDRVLFGIDEIERINPHRAPMRLLDAIVYLSDDQRHVVAYKDVTDDEFWVEGHIPGRPIFPGVLMIEAAAQLASFLSLRQLPDVQFIGFAGVNRAKFRGKVAPGDRLVLLAHMTELRRRRSICRTQGWVNGTLVFEGTITGMPM